MGTETRNTSKIIFKGEDRTRGAVRSARGGFTSLTRSIGGVTAGFLSVYAAIAAVNKAMAETSSLQNMENRLRLVAGAGGDVEAIQQRLFDIALRTRQPVGDLAETYARLGLAADASGIALSDLEGVVETIGKASAISGASSQEAANAIRQFTQGFQSGRFAGEELRAVLEQLPRLAKLIADGMGVSIGKLRELGKTGKLTTQQLHAAIKKGAGDVATEFETMDITIDQATTNLKTSLRRLLDAWVVNTGAASDFADMIDKVAQKLSAAADNDPLERRAEVLEKIRKLQVNPRDYTVHQSLAELRSELAGINEELHKAGRKRLWSDLQADAKSATRRLNKADADATAAKAADVEARRPALEKARGANEPDVISDMIGSRDEYRQALRDRAADKAEANQREFEERRDAMIAQHEEMQGIMDELGISPESELDAMRNKHAEERLLLEEKLGHTEEYLSLEAALKAKHHEEEVAMAARSAHRERTVKQKLYGDLITLAGAFGKRGQRIARAITAVQKAESFIQSVMSIQTGAAKALELPFPANIGAVATVLATGASLLATLRSVGAGGGSAATSGGGGGGEVLSPVQSVAAVPVGLEEPKRREIKVTFPRGGERLLSVEQVRQLVKDIAEQYGGDGVLNVSVV